MKAKNMLLDVIKDHLIPHVFEKNTMNEMFDSLVSFF